MSLINVDRRSDVESGPRPIGLDVTSKFPHPSRRETLQRITEIHTNSGLLVEGQTCVDFC
jgi:hypothetical protein